MKNEPWRGNPSERLKHLEKKISNQKYEIRRLQAELRAIKQRLERAETVTMEQFADAWQIRLDMLSIIFGQGTYCDMQPGETRMFKLVPVIGSETAQTGQEPTEGAGDERE